jgi:hypothetical protein
MPAPWLGSSLRRLRVSIKALALPGLAGFFALVFGLLVGPVTNAGAVPVSYMLVGTAGANGWYRSDVTIRWVVDPTDLVSAPTCPAAELITSEGTTTRQCTATYTGGVTVTSPVVTIKIDKTLPSVPVGTAARAADANGWYNHTVVVNFSSSDAVSGIDTCLGISYSGPDSATALATGTCKDNAGNMSSGSLGLSYDATRPSASGSLARAPNGNGWYNQPVTLNVSGSDATSGVASCAGATYAGPDGSARQVSGTCTDTAGNTSLPTTSTLSYDTTPPTNTAGSPARSPDSNGWYNQPIALSVSGTDATSGIGSCGGPSYSGPDGSARTITGSCTDRAGNTGASVTATVKYDATAPTASGSLARGPDANGWYNHPVAFNLTGSDATSGIGTCGGSYAGPDGTGRQVVGRCTDVAGNQSSAVTATIDYDATKPIATATADRPPNTNGWYRSPLTISFTQLAGDSSGPDTCSAPAGYSGPDVVSTTRSGTCTDKAGNTSAPATATIKYDATPPTASGALARGPDANGWYNHPVALGVTGTDAMSGIASCSGPSYSGPDGTARTITGSCTDQAGNTNAAVTATLKYDATAPTASGSLARGPDGNGWYNHPVALDLSGTDAMSGIASCSGGFSGPDGDARVASGTCIDVAGNASAPVTAALKYDATAPSATGTLARAPDVNGWYNRPLALQVSGTDATSGVASCASPSYAGPDSASRELVGTCVDRAGNTSAPATATIKYDATAPAALAGASRAPDANGWYSRPLTIVFAQVAGDVSGPDTCTPSVSYAGPDKAGISRTGSCTDRAGNTSSPVTLAFKYDATAPTATGSIARGPDANGWYNHPVGFDLTGTDATSGIGSCGGASFVGPDSPAAVATGRCTDVAGNASPAVTATIKYDATPPATSVGLSRAPDANGWYNRPVSAGASGQDPVSGVESCSGSSYGGPDSGAAALGGGCRDAAGNESSVSVSLRYDATAPSMRSIADRVPDGRGWYRRAMTVTFVGADAVSGVASCTAPTRYAGPDDPTASVAGSCRDAAGNTAELAHKFLYDATAPKLGKPKVEIERRMIRIAWERPADAVSIELVRAPGVNGARSSVMYRGTGRSFADKTVHDGIRYRYAIRGADLAGNVAEAVVNATPRRPLYRPARGAVVRAPLVFAWEPVQGVTFYNFQLLRDRIKVLSAWPGVANLQLGSSWRYAGKRYRLEPGVYDWYVWGARGSRERPVFGRPLGSSSFVVKGP